MECWRGIHCFSCLQFLFLAVFQASTEAYVSVNLENHCQREGTPPVYLQSKGLRAAATVELNVKTSRTPTAVPHTGDAICRLHVVAPPNHLLTVHIVRPKTFSKPVAAQLRHGFLPCYLRLNDRQPDEDVSIPTMHSRTFDLCDSSESPRTLENQHLGLLLLQRHLTLEWSPPDSSLAEKMIATHLVITAVGRGAEVCNLRHRTYCRGNAFAVITCIPSDLVCDGFQNCPMPGSDESPEDCAIAVFKSSLGSSEETREQDPHRIISAFLTRAVMKQMSGDISAMSTTTSKPGQNKRLELTSGMLKDMSDLILKKLLNKHKSDHIPEDSNSTNTTTPRSLWHDHATDSSNINSIPTALAHYGPWGYLMLGMLICGAVLMLCGLWECCCRSPKHHRSAGGPVSTSAATTVFIINSGSGIGSHRSATQPEESPPTPGPPSYEELDQPPSYSSLFPMTKICDTETTNIEDNHVIATDHI